MRLRECLGMPLLNGVVFSVDRNLSPELKPEAEVWHYRPTGETFVSYQDLLDRQNLCRSRLFTSGYTGKSGLNFEAAQREDERAKLALQQVRHLIQHPPAGSSFRQARLHQPWS